jgi:hypothetical protein
MEVLYLDNNSIACLFALLLIINHEDAFTFYASPNLGTIVVNLIANVFAREKCDALCKGMTTICTGGVIKHAISAPSTFLIHWTWAEILNVLLDFLEMLFATNEETIRTCCNYEILETIGIDRELKFVDNMSVLTMLTQPITDLWISSL